MRALESAERVRQVHLNRRRFSQLFTGTCGTTYRLPPVYQHASTHSGLAKPTLHQWFTAHQALINTPIPLDQPTPLSRIRQHQEYFFDPIETAKQIAHETRPSVTHKQQPPIE
jgi:hypothetical protein